MTKIFDDGMFYYSLEDERIILGNKNETIHCCNAVAGYIEPYISIPSKKIYESKEYEITTMFV